MGVIVFRKIENGAVHKITMCQKRKGTKKKTAELLFDKVREAWNTLPVKQMLILKYLFRVQVYFQIRISFHMLTSFNPSATHFIKHSLLALHHTTSPSFHPFISD